MLTKDKLLSLLGTFEAPVATITLPTHRKGPEVAQDRIRLKNLVRDAQQALEKEDNADIDAADILQPAEALIDDDSFWAHQNRGLALFLDRNRSEIVHVPVRLDEFVSVGEDIAVAPFADLLMDDKEYLLLAAAYDDVRLFRGNRFSLQAVHTSDIPGDMQKLLGLTDIEGAVHFHPTGPTPTTHGEATAKHHSLGPSAQDEQKQLKDQFAADLARSMDKYLAKRNFPPLVLVADDALIGAYGASAKQEPLTSTDTRVTPAHLDEDELRALAWPLVRESLDAHAEALDRFNAHWKDGASDKAIADPEEILEAARHARIETLLIQRQETGFHAFSINGGMPEHLDEVARRTVQTGGEICLIPPEQMPSDVVCGAILRF